jgi:hypothetical protein
MPNGRRTSTSPVEPLTDLSLGDLCVLLCGSLFRPMFSESERGNLKRKEGRIKSRRLSDSVKRHGSKDRSASAGGTGHESQ